MICVFFFAVDFSTLIDLSHSQLVTGRVADKICVWKVILVNKT